MIEWTRSFLVVLEEGSMNRASSRLHITQPSLTRQMQALEHEIGGPLLERMAKGVRPTALGQAFAATMTPILGRYDGALAELRRQARGQWAALRIGYIGSAAHTYLNPALVALRKKHPEAKVKLLDLTPCEQMAAMEKGEIDIALVGQEGASLAKEFYTRKLITLGACVALPLDHPLADRSELRPQDLKGEVFVGAPEAAVPGRNRWVTRICRKGGFRPKFVVEGESIGESFSLVASEGAILVLPDYFAQGPPPGTKVLPLVDEVATWDLLVMWQRGRASSVMKTMIDLLVTNAKERSQGASSKRA